MSGSEFGALLAVETVLSAVNTLSSAGARSSAAASAAENARLQAERQRQATAAAEETSRRSRSRELAAQRAQAGAAGVTLAGSPLLSLLDAAMEAELEARRIRSTGLARARNLDVSANSNALLAASANRQGLLGTGAGLAKDGQRLIPKLSTSKESGAG